MIIPDQLSCDPTYPGYRDDWPVIGANLVITLNGVEQQMVIAYDKVAGWVIRCEQTPDGKIVLKGDEAALETVNGAVAVEYSVKA